MPKQVKEKAKMWYFAFLDAARTARSKQAGNPLFGRDFQSHISTRRIDLL